MKTCTSIVFVCATLAQAGTWTGKLVDATCKASSEASCAASAETHLFAIELPDAQVLVLDASGDEKAAAAIKNSTKTDVRATVTGSLEGQKLKVETIELQ